MKGGTVIVEKTFISNPDAKSEAKNNEQEGVSTFEIELERVFTLAQ